MNRIGEWLKMFWPSAIVLAVILYGTLNNDPVGADELPPIPYLDKWIHAIMMGGLVGAIAFDWQRADKSVNRLTPRFMWPQCLAVVCFGLVDECLQSLMPNDRMQDWLDFVADCVGAVVAALISPPVIHKVLEMKTGD